MIEVPLTQNQVALIDDDFEIVSGHKWSALWNPKTKSFYAVTNIRKPDGKRTTIQMHRLIMNAKKGEQVDHIHHLTLDNRRSELRLCTNAQNQHNSGKRANNTSGYKGVDWHKASKKWRARICHDRKSIVVGYFGSPKEAWEARCLVVSDYHKEFSRIE